MGWKNGEEILKKMDNILKDNPLQVSAYNSKCVIYNHQGESDLLRNEVENAYKASLKVISK